MQNNFDEIDNKIIPLFMKVSETIKYHNVYEETLKTNDKKVEKHKFIWIK